jgi:putative spermidine/putrescine transport system ATP-binding protein
MAKAMPAITLKGVTKSFGKTVAVNNLDLEIGSGEFFSMLGPSGSGKTTVLRLIAGFELPDSGTIELAGTDVTNLAPFDRDVNTVFQDYALFGHMSVFENVEYGLRVRKVNKAERKVRAMEALETVRLADFADRKPSQLSGGQRQRVALARSIVVKPKVLLLDEPLGALDMKLREQMQIELKQLQRMLGITFIFVTHDQEEALTLSDRIAVFNNGAVEQLGTPEQLYLKPKSEFVAGFVGTSNIFNAEQSKKLFGKNGKFALRPENIEILTKARAGSLRATVEEVIYLGSFIRLLLEVDGIAIKATVTDGVFHRDQTVQINMSVTDLVAL